MGDFDENIVKQNHRIRIYTELQVKENSPRLTGKSYKKRWFKVSSISKSNRRSVTIDIIRKRGKKKGRREKCHDRSPSDREILAE